MDHQLLLFTSHLSTDSFHMQLSIWITYGITDYCYLPAKHWSTPMEVFCVCENNDVVLLERTSSHELK